jgi:hypothetical protein
MKICLPLLTGTRSVKRWEVGAKAQALTMGGVLQNRVLLSPSLLPLSLYAMGVAAYNTMLVLSRDSILIIILRSVLLKTLLRVRVISLNMASLIYIPLKRLM